jgi:hypothetical protein
MIPIDLVLLVAINALIDTIIVLVLQKRSFNTQLQNIWNMKVELTDLNGEVIKVPVTKIVKNKDGNELEQTDMIVAPLWYTILYGAGTMAAQQVKMSILSAKGKISRELNTAAMQGIVSPAMAAGLEMLPKKWQGPAAIILQLVGKGQPQGGPDQSSKHGQTGGKGVFE